MESINEDFAAHKIVMFQQEMSGHAHPSQRKANPLGHVHVHHGESDGNAQFAIKHLVEE